MELSLEVDGSSEGSEPREVDTPGVVTRLPPRKGVDVSFLEQPQPVPRRPTETVLIPLVNLGPAPTHPESVITHREGPH